MADKFRGVESDTSEFFTQFELIAALNGWADTTKVVTIAAYLDGPAKYFYRKIFTPSLTYTDLKEKFLAEFPSGINHSARFYLTKQGQNESPIEFLYRLEGLAEKAKIVDSQIIIKQFLTAISYNYKRYFATQIYPTIDILKETLNQFQNVISTRSEELNLPIKVTELTRNRVDGMHPYAGDSSTLVSPRAFSTPVAQRRQVETNFPTNSSFIPARQEGQFSRTPTPVEQRRQFGTSNSPSTQNFPPRQEEQSTRSPTPRPFGGYNLRNRDTRTPNRFNH